MPTEPAGPPTGASARTPARPGSSGTHDLIASPVRLRDLAAAVTLLAAAVEQSAAGLVRAADLLSRCPVSVASAGWELVRCARAALVAESDELRRVARAITDGADAYRTNDLRLATTMDPR